MKELYKYKDRVLVYDTETKEVKELDKETARKVIDFKAKNSMRDAVKTFTIRWRNTTDRVTSRDIVTASSLSEALRKVANQDENFGVGTSNMVLISASSDTETYQISGNFTELMKRNIDSLTKDGRYDNYYGEEEANKYGAKIIQALRGKTITKRKDKSDQPGGLEYEAKKLGIDMWDFLKALEGLCYQGKADETSDSTYRIRDSLTKESIGVKDSISESQALENFKRFLKKYYEYTDEDLKKVRVELEKVSHPFKKSEEVWYGLPNGKVASYYSLDGKKWEDI